MLINKENDSTKREQSDCKTMIFKAIYFAGFVRRLIALKTFPLLLKFLCYHRKNATEHIFIGLTHIDQFHSRNKFIELSAFFFGISCLIQLKEFICTIDQRMIFGIRRLR